MDTQSKQFRCYTNTTDFFFRCQNTAPWKSLLCIGKIILPRPDAERLSNLLIFKLPFLSTSPHKTRWGLSSVFQMATKKSTFRNSSLYFCFDVMQATEREGITEVTLNMTWAQEHQHTFIWTSEIMILMYSGLVMGKLHCLELKKSPVQFNPII